MSVEFGTSGVSPGSTTTWVLRSMEEQNGAFHYATSGKPTTDLNTAATFDTLELAEAERARRHEIMEWVPTPATREGGKLRLGHQAVTDENTGLEEI
jgi:hypothetical protein